jgi:hypothetical protein
MRWSFSDEYLAEVRRYRCLRNHPRLIQRLHHLLGQWPLLQIRQISLQLPEATHANDHPIVATFSSCLQLRMMRAPPQRDFEKRQIMLLRHALNELERFEVRVLEVSFAVHLAEVGILCEPTFIWSYVCRLDLAAEQPAGEGVVDNDVDLVFAAAGDELRFDVAGL